MPTTDLEELKTAWQQLNRELERQNALTLEQLKENKLARFRSGLRPLILGQKLQLVMGAVITGFAAQFWVNHVAVMPLVISGIFLQLYGIMFIAFAVRDLVLIHRIDYSAPVLKIQKQLAELRSWHIRAAGWHGITGSIVWLPVMLIVLHFLGADFRFDKPQKIYWLLATAVVCVALNYSLMFLARSRGRCGTALRTSWVGRSVNRARETLEEIEQFERELT